MYFDDAYDPNEENDYDDYNSHNEVVESDISTINSLYNKRQFKLDEMKVYDSGMHIIERMNPNNKKTKIKIYETSYVPGCYIRNAISGNRYGYKVGSYNEDLLFKVAFATGETGQNTSILYYTYPEQFENHMYTTLSEDCKMKWKTKQEKRMKIVSETVKLKNTIVR